MAEDVPAEGVQRNVGQVGDGYRHTVVEACAVSGKGCGYGDAVYRVIVERNIAERHHGTVALGEGCGKGSFSRRRTVHRQMDRNVVYGLLAVVPDIGFNFGDGLLFYRLLWRDDG